MVLRLSSLSELTGGKAKRHKFGAKKTELDGVTHDSKKEATRWAELQTMQKAGLISELERQVTYVLAPSVKFSGSARAQPPLRIVVDFRYRDTWGIVLEDCKSEATVTAAFTIKRHLLLAVHGLQIKLS